MATAQSEPPPRVESSASTNAQNSDNSRSDDVSHGDEEQPRTSDDHFHDYEAAKSVRSSLSHLDPEPGFAHVDGDIRGTGYNETTVDIVAVPCPGASPVETWTRDPLPDDFFNAPFPESLKTLPTVAKLDSILYPGLDRHLPKAKPLWIRQGIRKEINTARVLLYRHRELADGLTLDKLADDLLEHLCHMREGLRSSRPFFLVCHSIGGLVAKLALVKASQKENLRPIVYDCFGITFFATPHVGSSYLSMPMCKESIQHILFLHKPLPWSIMEELHLNHKSLLQLQDRFMELSSELKIWTFYETMDSLLSGFGDSHFDEVHFSAPVASIKSSLLNTRHEQAFSLHSDHAHCASFGPENTQMMYNYLYDLGKAVKHAQALSSQPAHIPMRLAEHVKMEIIGFYDDPDPDRDRDIRLYITKQFLKEFLEVGPEKCLQERLNKISPKRHHGILPSSARLKSIATMKPALDMSTAIGTITRNVQGLGQRILGTPPRSRSNSQPQEPGAGAQSPDINIVVSQPSAGGHGHANSLPENSARLERGLTVPALSTPGFHRPSNRVTNRRTDFDEAGRTMSEPTMGELSPKTAGPSVDQAISGDNTLGISGGSSTEHDTRNRFSQPAELQDVAAGFSRPDPLRRKFMWIHLPFNNPLWVKNVFDIMGQTQHRSFSRLLRNENWFNRHVRGRHGHAHTSYVRSGCGFVAADAPSPRPSSPTSKSRSPSPSPSPSYLYLYLPYLHYDTYKALVERRKLLKRRTAQGRTRPVPKDVAAKESLELRMIWEYIGHDPPLNIRRTLDQYGYPSLRDTNARDDDQMLYKLTKERGPLPFGTKVDDETTPVTRQQSNTGTNTETTPASSSAVDILFKAEAVNAKLDDNSPTPEEEVLNGNVLMVDQLWLWAVDTKTVATFFPKRESELTEGPLFQQADLRNSIYNELNGDLTGRCETAFDLAAFIALHAVTVLLDRSSHPDLEIFRIFEEALGILTERMTVSLKRFRMQTFKDNIHDESDDESDDDNSPRSTRRRFQRDVERAERENRENTSALLELRDMEDELNTLKNLFTEQQAVIESMKTQYEKPTMQSTTQNGRIYLTDALQRLDEYKKQTMEMLERVDGTRKDYEKLLEMIQRQAQVDEVRWSRLQTELAGSQNTSVIIFTVFTVLFLPLSFFTGLFGMNVDDWSNNVDNMTNYLSLWEVGAIALPASAFLIILAMVLAFSSRAQSLLKAIFKIGEAVLDELRSLIAHLEPEASRRAKAKRKRLREQQLKEQQRQRERTYDFWAGMRTERGSQYEIPELNRRAQDKQQMEARGFWQRARQSW